MDYRSPGDCQVSLELLSCRHNSAPCSDGGIGIRTSLRCWREQSRGGSSPLLSTSMKPLYRAVLCLENIVPISLFRICTLECVFCKFMD